MKNTDILKRAYQITVANPVLWLVGIFLSSGFNAHFWYLWSKLQEFGAVEHFFWQVKQIDKEFLAVLTVMLLVGGLILINYIKLVFLYFLHDHLHDSKMLICWLCKQRTEQKSFLQLNINKALGRTILVSVITILVSLFCVGFFNWYIGMSEDNLPTVVLTFLCLLILLVGVSLWGLFMIVSLFWYNLKFAAASKIVLDLMFLKLNRVAVMATLVTIIFLVSVAVGGIVIWQIPKFVASSNFLFFTDPLTHALQVFTQVAALILFFIWLTLNNVWFNVAMVILYNNLVKAQKTEVPAEVVPPVEPLPAEV